MDCLLRPNLLSEKKYNNNNNNNNYFNYYCFLEFVTRDPSIYTMGHPDFIVCSFMDNSIGLKRVNDKKH